MILTSFSFIYENKTKDFTKLRFDHTFDYLRLNKRMGSTLHGAFDHSNCSVNFKNVLEVAVSC